VPAAHRAPERVERGDGVGFGGMGTPNSRCRLRVARGRLRAERRSAVSAFLRTASIAHRRWYLMRSGVVVALGYSIVLSTRALAQSQWASVPYKE
jgi:hypothetical protein